MSEAKFKLGQRVESFDSQGWTKGIVIKICLRLDGTTTYMLNSDFSWYAEEKIRELINIVTLELSRRTAERIAAYIPLPLTTDLDKELIKAARKALG